MGQRGYIDFIMLCFVALLELWYIFPLNLKPFIKMMMITDNHVF